MNNVKIYHDISVFCDLETIQGSFCHGIKYNGIQYNHNVKEALYILELYQH